MHGGGFSGAGGEVGFVGGDFRQQFGLGEVDVWGDGQDAAFFDFGASAEGEREAEEAVAGG